MKIISFKDIEQLHIAPSECHDWAETMFRNKRQAMLPPKISLKPADGVFCNVMPSFILGASGNMGG